MTVQTSATTFTPAGTRIKAGRPARRRGSPAGALSRRDFFKDLLLAQAGLALLPGTVSAAATAAARSDSFSFVFLGDLHFDKLEHHDLEALQRDKPDDARQVRDYSRITRDLMPQLFASVRDTVAELNQQQAGQAAFVLQAGDLVEGLCGSLERAARQNTEALAFVRETKLGVPFLFTKGNHDVTGSGAVEAFDVVFKPFLFAQAAAVQGSPCKVQGARYTVEHGGAQFCIFDAYDKQSLPWLEAELARRTARHCFVILHPPVVPYGARSTWHVFSREQDRAQRERLLQLLGKHNAFVLGGHIHKYNLLARTTPGGGRFVQFALSSVVSQPEVTPKQLLTGVASYNEDQVTVEPAFSPTTEKERRAVYREEAPFVKAFEYADLPGYSVVSVAGDEVTAKIYSGVSRKLWRTLKLRAARDA